MTRQITLTKKILLLALLDVVALGLILGTVVAVQFSGNLGTLLISAVRDDVLRVSTSFIRDLEETPAEGREALAERYRRESGFDFYLFIIPTRKQIAGVPLTLPPEVDLYIQGTVPGRVAAARRANPSRPPPALTSAAREPTEPLYIRSSGPIRHWIGIAAPVRIAEQNRMEPSIFLFGFPTVMQSPLAKPLMMAVGIIGLASFVSVMCWLPLVRGLKVAIAKMKQATERIADGRFDVEIGVKRNDEVGYLANAIGRMASRLENYVKGQRRFFGDIAHELRTPIGRMRVTLEMAGQDADERQAKHIARLQREIDLMSEITDQFITLAKSETGHGKIEPVRVAEIVDRVVQIENDAHAEIKVHVDSDLEAMAQPEYLFRSLSNLVRNSVRYAGAEGPIEVSAERNNGSVWITVADSGPGVPENSLEKIFEPFYRIDDSRDRRTGGTGLGLAIVRSCTEACQGALEARNRRPHGLAVTIKLQAR